MRRPYLPPTHQPHLLNLAICKHPIRLRDLFGHASGTCLESVSQLVDPPLRYKLKVLLQYKLCFSPCSSCWLFRIMHVNLTLWGCFYFLWVHWKYDFKSRGLQARFVQSQIDLKSILVQYSAQTSVMWKPEASSSQCTLRIDFTVMEETTWVQFVKWIIFAYS